MNRLAAFRRAGILGINRRNTQYTLRWNKRSLYPLVDDKIKTKHLCERAGVPTAQLFAVARTQGDVREMIASLAPHPSFVLKPSRGAMGNGILVILDREGDRYKRTGGRWMDESALRYHASGIISGLYALGGQPDAAFAEERLEVHPEFTSISSNGVPDVRIIVYRGVPVMAMTRLPTNKSDGRANLHQGAIGAGIDLETGRTVHAVIGNESTDIHPDSKESVVGRTLPDFARALEIAVRASDATGLGYVGADVVIDARHGALILELNARPGLAIQVANKAGLLPRLNAVDAAWRPDMPFEERLAIGRSIGRRRQESIHA